MSAFQRLPGQISAFQFSAFQLLPDQVSAFALLSFSFSAFPNRLP
jgi:hypothetical protein